MARVVRTPEIVRHNWRFTSNDLSGWTDLAKYDLIDDKSARIARVNKLMAMRLESEKYPLEPEALDFGSSIVSKE